MRRLFWLGLGATVGALAVRKVSKTVDAYTPAGMGRSLASFGEGLSELAAVVREGMAEREHELRLALGVEEGDQDPEAAQSVLHDPASPYRH